MKQLLFIILLLESLALIAQQSEIKGIISIHNSEYETGKRQYVANAQVEDDFSKATPQITDVNGNFKLVFVRVPEKISVQLMVKKEDLQIVNIDGLSVVTGQRDLARLSMAKPDKIAEYRRQIYQVGKTEAEKNLAAQLKKKGEQIETLQKDAVKNKMTIEKLQKQYAELQSFGSKIEDQAQDLARRYAPINLDDAAPLYRESFRLFQRGDLSQALQILRGANLVNQASKILAEEHAISELQKQLIKRDSIKEQRKKDLMEALGLKADLHKAKFEWDSVLFCLQLRMNLDSANVSNISALAYFLSKQNKIHEASAYYEKALALAQSPELRANFLNNLGVIYSSNQKMHQAEAAFLEALKIRKQLANKNPDTSLRDLAGTINNLGNYYRANEKIPQAEASYLEALKITRQLVDKNSGSSLHDLADILNNLGVFYNENKKMHQAEVAYIEALKITRQLADKNPDAFLPNLAHTLNNLGIYYNANQKMLQADTAYNEALKIYQQLADMNSNAFLPYVATSLNNLGVYYHANQKMPQAEAAYLEALKVRRQLAQINPNAFLPDLALTLNNLGAFFKTSRNYKAALEHYKEALFIRETAILDGEIHHYRDWVQVILNIGTIKDSARLIKDYKMASYASRLLAEGYDKLKEVDKKLKTIATSEYGILSVLALFAKDYILSEKSALRCLELDNTQEWVFANLGHCQLLRGQYTTANATYEKLKGKKNSEGQDYKQVLLYGLKALEAEGITHKDFTLVRTSIEKW